MPSVMRTKCVIVGDTKVGKTAITQMFLTNGKEYAKNYNMTLGADLFVKKIKIPEKDDSVEMYLYDCSGRDIYMKALPTYWVGPNLVLAVFDVTSQSSFDSVEKWASFVKKAIPEEAVSTTPCVLFGNKTDLTERRVVSPKSAAALAETLGFHYFEGSAMEYQGIEEPFYLLAHEWHKLCELARGDK